MTFCMVSDLVPEQENKVICERPCSQRLALACCLMSAFANRVFPCLFEWHVRAQGGPQPLLSFWCWSDGWMRWAGKPQQGKPNGRGSWKKHMACECGIQSLADGLNHPTRASKSKERPTRWHSKPCRWAGGAVTREFSLLGGSILLESYAKKCVHPNWRFVTDTVV
eukprot:1138987-Pelagomonas_calceolata.AAC.12